MENSVVRRVLAAAGAFGALLVLTVSATTDASASPTPMPPVRVEAVLDAADVPGAAVTVVSSSSVGRTVTTDEEPISGARRVGSVSKGVAGAVADALVQDGKVSLEEPVGTYLPTLREPYRSLTLEQLLTHTSGLPQDVTVTDGDRPEATATALLDNLPAHPDLGSEYRYSSLNYILVQAVIEARAGTSYDAAIAHHLGGDTLRADCATPVEPGRLPFFTGELGAPDVCDGGGFGYGYLAGDQTQLARWAQWNLSAAGRAFHERSRQHSVEVRDGQRYGFGWNYGRTEVAGAVRETIEHPGAIPGTYTLVKLVPELDTAVVVSIPSFGELRADETTELADRAVAAALGDPLESATTRMSTGSVVLGVALAAVLGALGVVALQVRRIVSGRARSAWRMTGAALATFAAWVGLVVGLPLLTGVDVGTLANWAPDLALLVVLLAAVATLSLVLSGLQRGRRIA